MASTLVNLVKITAASSGTGAITLGAPSEGYRGIEALVNGGTYSYSIQQGSNFEYGRGTYLSAGHQFTRSPLSSSYGGPPIKVQVGDTIAFVALADDFASTVDMDAAIAAADAASAAGAAASAAAAEATTAAANAEAAAASVEAGLSEKADIDLPVFTGLVTASGDRPTVFNPALGQVTIKGDAAGWSTGYSFLGSAGSYFGGFGALGGGDALTYLFMGTAYNSPENLRVYPNGLIGWGTDVLTVSVEHRPAMKSIKALVTRSVHLAEAGREGTFICRAGSPPLTDTLEGLYVVSNTAGFYWERVWDGIHGLPEWFGAIPNNSGIDNVAAIQACLSLCGTCQLGAGDYYTASTVAISGYQQRLIGQGMHQNSGKGTRVVCTSATADVCCIGPAAPTYDGNGNISFANLVYNQLIDGIEFTRSVQPSTDVVQANGDVGAVGVRIQFTLSATVNRCKSQDSIYNWVWEGNINLYLLDPQATRGLAGSGSNPDLAVGYKAITGSGTPITASISGTTLTVTGVASSAFAPLAVGSVIFLGGVSQGSITALGTGTGGNDTYTLSASHTVSSQLMMAAPAGYTRVPTPPLTNINGNASCRLVRALASLGITTNSYGLILSRFFTDHSIERFETAACSTGILISGDAATLDAINTNASLRRNANVELIAPWIDQFGIQGIRIDGVDKFGMIRIDGGYFGPSSTATACVYITSSTGAVALNGPCEMAMAATNGGSCRGVLAIDSNNITIGEGWNVVEGTYRAYEFNNCKGVTHRGMSTNNQNSTGAQTYLLSNAETSLYAPCIRGVAGAVAVGVQFVGNIGLKSTVDISRIDWGCIAGANDPARKANVLQYNGGSVTVGATTSTAFGNGCLGMGNPG